MPTILLRYPASVDNVDTGMPLTEASAIARCDGVVEPTNLADLISAHEVPNISLVSISPTLRFDEPRESLTLELEVVTKQALAADERALLVLVLKSLLETWPYAFALPNEAWQVHFETTPVSSGPTPQVDDLETIRRRWPTYSFESLAALSDEELDRLLSQLRPLKAFVAKDRSSDAQHARGLLEAAESQKQRRALPEAPPNGDDWI